MSFSSPIKEANAHLQLLYRQLATAQEDVQEKSEALAAAQKTISELNTRVTELEQKNQQLLESESHARQELGSLKGHLDHIHQLSQTCQQQEKEIHDLKTKLLLFSGKAAELVSILDADPATVKSLLSRNRNHEVVPAIGSESFSIADEEIDI
eukprot:TRINITY_DN8839_c0_g2_i2.p1 TRINITY_DN8839_c0_g2~~TRINITY_DN8839_c0_g2_i2.p1  ORF type:complete len:153 (+),score=22.95 TRINITY_DN8839_c0_g2_i2:116-574(+)